MIRRLGMASNPLEIHGCLIVSLILTALTIVPVTASAASESESQAELPSTAAGSSYPILPRREGLPPKVTLNIPNRQIDVNPVPEVNEELFRRAFALPGVENRPTILSVPGVRGLWLNNKISLVHPEIIRRGREFAHIHADGSLHIALPVERAREAVRAGWALPHPMSNQEGWEGFVLLYTPQSMEQLDSTFQIIVDAYNYITGWNVRAQDFGKK
jgi:hypothetical protein